MVLTVLGEVSLQYESSEPVRNPYERKLDHSISGYISSPKTVLKEIDFIVFSQ